MWMITSFASETGLANFLSGLFRQNKKSNGCSCIA
jgi:hypothetical protein